MRSSEHPRFEYVVIDYDDFVSWVQTPKADRAEWSVSEMLEAADIVMGGPQLDEDPLYVFLWMVSACLRH